MQEIGNLIGAGKEVDFTMYQIRGMYEAGYFDTTQYLKQTAKYIAD